MKIQVTQEDIDLNGHSCNCCPVYRAIQKHTLKHIVVSSHSIHEGNKDKCCEFPDDSKIIIHHSEKVKNWIWNHDNYYNFERPPFEFNLSAECFIL